MPDNVIIGVNILEILTTGMYRDAKVIFREYIQNSCDQIDLAVENDLLAQGEGRVDLWIDEGGRTVRVEDNATGIPAKLFRQTLYSIGESRKTLGKNKGFRGIGHWCGLGYCKTLVLTSKAIDETIESIMTCDAEKMRRMMDKHNSHESRYTVDEVLKETVRFSNKNIADTAEHYFKVEMFGIRDVHTELCTLQKVKDYLSFVAPVAYDPAFRFKTKIHKHAKDIGKPIQEYNIRVYGEPIFKKYTPHFTTHSKGEDTITDIDFKDFCDEKGNLVAWLWFGISSFKAQILKDNQMRGIRLRAQNIQIGDDDALQKRFKEDRGHYYFIGELFAIAKDLIPNSQRDYFNENEARLEFERLVEDFFNDDLGYIYKESSKVNSRYDKIEKAVQLETEISDAVASGRAVPGEQYIKLEHAKNEAERAKSEIVKISEKIKTQEQDSNVCSTSQAVIKKIIETNEETRKIRPAEPAKPGKTTPTAIIFDDKVARGEFQEKLVPLEKVLKIIVDLLGSSTADKVMKKIKKELL